jgi:signal transduction histidine kinase
MSTLFDPLSAPGIDWPATAVSVSLLIAVIASLFLAIRAFRRTLRTERDRRAEAEHALSRTSALEALARALSKAHTSAEVTQACLSELLPAAAATAGAVALVNDRTGHLDIVQRVGFADSATATADSVPLASRTFLTEVVRRQIPLTFISEEDRRRTFPDLSLDSMLEDAQGAFVLPLLVAGRTVGVVALTFRNGRECSSDDRAFLMGAVQRAGLALDRAMRYERAERARAELEAYRTQAEIEIRERQKAEEALRESEARYRALAARTTRLYTLNARLSEAITLDAVAQAIVRHGKVVAGASAGSVALLQDGALFENLYSEEYPREVVDAWQRFPAESGLCATAAVDTCSPVFIPSFEEWQQQYPRSASMAADGGFASAAVLPLLAEGSPIGVLMFHFTAPVNFDHDYRALLTSVAHHAAQAMDRARLYETAQRARADAEAANQSRDDFLSIVSHELRTPLSAVLGWASMLRNNSLDSSQTVRAIEAIYRNATRQAHLIDELLDVSRIVAGRAPLDFQEVDVAANVRGAVETIMPLAEAKGLQVRIAPFSAMHAVADPLRLEQVFVNLLGNAVKFTPEGGTIVVSVMRSDHSIDVRVQDSGCGIDAAFLPHVFERFRQADSTAARGVGGLGLGLFIARCLVDAHGGRIHVDSDGENRGSTFTVSVPVGVRSPSAMQVADIASVRRGAPADAVPSLDGIRILLVDDEPDSCEVIASALQACGATVRSTSSVDGAVEMLARGPEEFDVLLSDIAMPGKDGYELIRHVRAQSIGGQPGIPAAAVTACAGADERRRVLAAGFQMHLIKPIRPEALAHAVANLAHVEHATSAASIRRA